MAKQIQIDVANVRDVRIERIVADELSVGYGFVLTATYDLQNITDEEQLASAQVVLQLDKQSEVQAMDNLLTRLLDKARADRKVSTVRTNIRARGVTATQKGKGKQK